MLKDLAYTLQKISFDKIYWILIFLLIGLHILFMFTFFKWYNNIKWIKIISIIFSCIIILLSLFDLYKFWRWSILEIDNYISIIVFVVEILWMLYYLGIYNNGLLKYTGYLQIFNLIIVRVFWLFSRALDRAF